METREGGLRKNMLKYDQKTPLSTILYSRRLLYYVPWHTEDMTLDVMFDEAPHWGWFMVVVVAFGIVV